jgi:formimidoylglutamate deiminase
MYAAAAELTPQSLYATACACYREMLAAGYTTVGEFHYVHHRPDGTPYDDPLAMSRALLDAATTTGIRLVLLPVAYTRGGFDRPAEPRQRRFCFSAVEGYLEFVDALRALVADPRHSVGVAPHSVRAVPVDWLERIAAYAREHGLVVHVHASEQVAEVRETQAHHGCTPIELLARYGVLGPAAAVVHATHATEQDCRAMAAAGAHVCVCPTTEGDLGDGVAPYASFVEHGIALAIGSDGQTRIDPWEELRWAEFSARMRYQRRRVLAPGTASPGALLLRAGSAWGAASLGLETGSLEPGRWADLIAVNLDHPALQGADPATLRDTLIFGAAADVVTDVWVGGRRLDLQ